MCGIFGILLQSPSIMPSDSLLRRSAELLAHRGPDHSSTFSAAGIGLAHTRLSLVDPSPRSHQPIWDQSGRYALVYNGEVYNHPDLRARLESDGFALRTTSDTEVLLESFVRFGISSCLPDLDGMFALGFYDSQDGSLVVARDRFGIKPLYIHEDSQGFSFASEAKSMKPWVALNPDVLTIASYLEAAGGFIGPVTRASFFEDVRMVPPGWMVEVQRGHRTRTRRFAATRDFWDPEEARRLNAMRDGRLVDLVDENLHRAVKAQLHADAPVGVFCSGGVDSTVIAAIASQYQPNIRLFHADVVGKHSERYAAELVADHLHLDLESVAVHDDDFLERIPQIIRHYEYPFSGRPHSVPFLMVSQLVRDHGVKGVLSGEGSDECYFGYRKTVPRLHEVIQSAPRRALNYLARSLRVAMNKPRPLRRQLADYGQNLAYGERRLATELLNHFDRHIEHQEVVALLSGLREGDADPRNLQVLTLLNYHLRTLLHRNDRLGMAASVEARFPFLDHSLVRLAANLPYRCRIRLTRSLADGSNPYVTGKWIVRKVANRYVPRSLSSMRKKGFKVSAAKRMAFTPNAFEGTFAADLLHLSRRELRFFMERSPNALKVKMMQVNVWGSIFMNDETDDAILSQIRRTVDVRTKTRRKNGLARNTRDVRSSEGWRRPIHFRSA